MDNLKSFGKYIVILILLAAGCFESVTAILQQFGRLESSHARFLITGTFPNPGPLGGFLAVSSTLLWGLIITSQNKRFRWVLVLLFGIIVYALILSDSRAGWMSALTGIVCISVWSWRKYLQQFIQTSYRKNIAVWAILIGAAGVLIFTYFYRPMSANGRLLIWRVCADMIADKPLFGFGVNGFANNYMLYQAEYFRLHPDSIFMECADNVAYPYNEFIHTLVNFGVVGLALLLFILYSVLSCPSSTCVSAILKSGFVSLLIFGCFSYPTSVFRLWILFPLFIVLLENKFARQSGLKFIGILFLLIATGYLSCLEIIGCQIKANCKKLYSGNAITKQEAIDYLDGHYEILKIFPRFMDIYAQYAMTGFDNEKRNRIIADAIQVVPSSGLYCDAGDIYCEMQQKDLAAKFYIQAANMVPRRILPKYKLFLLYYGSRQWDKALEIGSNILTLPIKVRGTKTLRLRAEIEEKIALIEQQNRTL